MNHGAHHHPTDHHHSSHPPTPRPPFTSFHVPFPPSLVRLPSGTPTVTRSCAWGASAGKARTASSLGTPSSAASGRPRPCTKTCARGATHTTKTRATATPAPEVKVEVDLDVDVDLPPPPYPVRTTRRCGTRTTPTATATGGAALRGPVTHRRTARWATTSAAIPPRAVGSGTYARKRGSLTVY